MSPIKYPPPKSLRSASAAVRLVLDDLLTAEHIARQAARRAALLRARLLTDASSRRLAGHE